MLSSKQELKTLVTKGRTDLAISKIVEIAKPLADQHFHNQVAALSSRWNTNERNNNLGTLAEDDYGREKDKINKAVLALIDELPKKSAMPKGLFIAAAVILVLFFLFKFISRKDSMQLTVFVQDAEGKPIPELQNNGKVIVRFGHDLRDPVIGENGRTNIGEIPSDFRGKEIEVVLVAEGWESIAPEKKYHIDGGQITLNVKRNNSLGIIQGIVRTRQNLEFIGGALVMVDHDTTLQTDSLGRFRLVLPEKMHKKEYLLTVKKEGFKDASEIFLPKTTPADIRLEK